MKNKKSGFTLGEVLCALAVVGIVSAMAVTMLKPADKKAVKYLYMTAFNSLEKAYYNSTVLGMNPFSTETFSTGVAPVHTANEDTGTQLLCQGLTTYINSQTNEKTSEHDYSTSCSSTNLISLDADEDFTKLASKDTDERNEILDKAQFVANNGMIFYITKMIEDETSGIKFYIVLVDVNGTKKPNSIEYTYKWTHIASEKTAEKNKIEPDIFAFAILENGRVCPLGIPEYDKDILTARFAYFDDNGDPVYTMKSQAYYQAKGSAWGFYSSTPPNPLTDYNIDEPYSMNDIIRQIITTQAPDSKIIKTFPDLTTLSPKTVESETYKCSNEDLESCYIFLDAYRQ